MKKIVFNHEKGEVVTVETYSTRKDSVDETDGRITTSSGVMFNHVKLEGMFSDEEEVIDFVEHCAQMLNEEGITEDPQEHYFKLTDYEDFFKNKVNDNDNLGITEEESRKIIKMDLFMQSVVMTKIWETNYQPFVNIDFLLKIGVSLKEASLFAAKMTARNIGEEITSEVNN